MTLSNSLKLNLNFYTKNMYARSCYLTECLKFKKILAVKIIEIY